MILTIGPGGSGLTFLNWSIIYLRGDNIYTLLNKEVIKVTHDPLLTNCTAHGQQKDHLNSTVGLKKLDLATDQSVVYIVPTQQSDLEYILQFTGKKIIFNSSTYSQELLARMWCAIPNNFLNKLVNDISLNYDKQSIKQVLLECNKFFTDYYIVPTTYTDYFNITYPDIFQNLDIQIYDVFEYLELTISQDRVSNWLSIYHKYRAMNQNFLPLFLDKTIEIDNNKKIEILKEIIKWKTGLYQHI